MPVMDRSAALQLHWRGRRPDFGSSHFLPTPSLTGRMTTCGLLRNAAIQKIPTSPKFALEGHTCQKDFRPLLHDGGERGEPTWIELHEASSQQSSGSIRRPLRDLAARLTS